MRRLAFAPALVALAMLAPTASAAGPQITDAANDANFLNDQGQPLLVGKVPSNNATAAGSQAYADVVSVQWKTLKATKVVKKKKKKATKVTTVTGFTVTAVLSAAPTPPQGTIVVYRMLGSTPACGFFGVAYYSTKLSDPTTPQSAVRDNCGGKPTRLTAIAPPVITGSTITWTVPLSVIPKDTKVGVGTVLNGLYFTTNEIQDLQGREVPKDVPIFGGSTGFGYGVIDDSKPGAASYKIA